MYTLTRQIIHMNRYNSDVDYLKLFFCRLAQQQGELFSLLDASGTKLERVEAQEFWRECQRWAYCLAKRPGPVVAIFGRTTRAMLSAWFGAVLVGHQPTFISTPNRKIEPGEYDRKLANYKTYFGHGSFVGMEEDRILCADLLMPNGLEDPPQGFVSVLEWESRLDQTLFLQCSSGTTGLQKAVAITPRMLYGQLASYAQAIGLDATQDHVVSWLPLYHDMGLVATFLLPLLTGTAVTFMDPFDWSANPSLLLSAIEQVRGTLCWLPNFAFAFLCRGSGSFDLTSMRAFINCSEPVSHAGMRRFAQHYGIEMCHIQVCYALAENVFAVSQTPLGLSPKGVVLERMAFQHHRVVVLQRGEIDQESFFGSTDGVVLVSCGRVLEGVEVEVKTRPGQQVGEVWISGWSAVSGYLNQEAVEVGGWFPTGDLGFFDQGELYLCGRSKDIIIHQGKNLYPHDLEAAVDCHPQVHPGRSVAIGVADAELGSERVLLLFESERVLALADRQQLCLELQRRLNLLFDMRSELACVPRGWLKKTSSGKMTRRSNLESYLARQQRQIHVVGDSHVRIFWTYNTSHRNIYRSIHAHWVGLLWSGNWQESMVYFQKMAQQAGAGDIVLIQAGEPECRSVFPLAADPLSCIAETVAKYGDFFMAVRRIWPGRLGYVTGIPTHPLNIDNQDAQWPIQGTPAQRYRYQEIFYAQMARLCTTLILPFIDVCTPLLGADGFLDPGLLCDKAHLDPGQRDLYFYKLEEAFGYIDTRLADPPEAGQAWDGSKEHFLKLMQARIRELAPLESNPDYDHLISTGLLDSLAIVELIAMCDQTFHFNIPIQHIQRGDFESLAGIYERFGPVVSGH
ncbi:MAG: AMP-binding protein [Magnetococcus sp. DMHC-6]